MKITAQSSKLLLPGLLALVLPACSLDRSVPVAPRHAYTASAQVRSGDGRTVPVGSDDLLLAGGTPSVLATWDGLSSSGETAEARMLAQWTRYLKRRLEDPAASAEFRARFGNPPFCLVSAAVRRTEATATPSPDEPGDALETCSTPMPDSCGNAPGVVPRLEATPPDVDFGAVPVGTLSTDTLVVLANAGAGRLCLDSPALDPALSPQLGDFDLDGSDCVPRSAEELAMGRTILDVSRPTCSLRLRFTPSDAGLRQAVLRLASGDPAQPVQNAALSGVGQPGVLRAVPSPLCLNTEPVMVGGLGICHRHNLRLVNDGPGVVTMRSTTLPAGSTDWALGGFVPGRPPDIAPLAPGAEVSMVVRVCGSDPPDTTLVVASNASLPSFEVTFLRPASGCVP